jgi:hypothetical protein
VKPTALVHDPDFVASRCDVFVPDQGDQLSVFATISSSATYSALSFL